MECLQSEKFEQKSTVCQLDIIKMSCKEGKLYFTNNKILGKRFHSKHLIQVNLKVAPAVYDKSSLLKSPVLFLSVEEVNQLVNTLLESEHLPKRLSRSGLKGILKDVHWWNATFICRGKTYIQLFPEKRGRVKRLRKNEQQANVKKKKRRLAGSNESDELSAQSVKKKSVGGRKYSPINLKAKLSYKDKVICWKCGRMIRKVQ